MLMWLKTATVTTTKVTAQQMWKLFANVNAWNSWDAEIEWTKMDGAFAV